MNKNTILIVSPHEATRESLVSILSLEGYSVFTASSGQEGLEILMTERPSLAIIDQAMPGIDGIETLRRFKEIKPETPVIMLSGHGTIETAIKAIKIGAFDYLVKPPELANLINTIKLALGGAKPE